MSTRTLALTQELYQYILDISLREPEILARLRRETALHPKAKMQIAPDQGQFMGLLVRLMGARKALEVGVFTGYSSLAVALAMPPGGKIVACDISAEFTSIAQRYWRAAGVDNMIDLRLAPAADTLHTLLQEGHRCTFDFGFIDADKEGYDAYYERTLQLMRPGGLIVIDNVLRMGEVVDASVTNSETAAIRALNTKLRCDDRVHLSLVGVGDGLTLALKK